MSPIFDDRFRKTLGEILRQAPRLRGGRKELARTRRRIRSESGTFSGHRAYSEGEDVRNLDWNVYARTDELFLKVLEDEDRIGFTLIFDRSASMLAGDRVRGAARLTAILGGLALVQLDGVHLMWGPGQDCLLQGAGALGRFLEQIESVVPTADSHDDTPPTAMVSKLLEHPVGHLAWVSDFADPRACQTGLAMLRKQGCRVRGWLPVLPADRVPVEDGYVRFEDPETGKQEVVQVDARLRHAMVEELAILARHQDVVFDAVGYTLMRFPVPAAGDQRIASWTADGAIYG